MKEIAVRNRGKVLHAVVACMCVLVLVSCYSAKPSEYILFDFESENELNRLEWNCHSLYRIAGMHASHGRKSLSLELFPSDYSAFSPIIAFTDWQGYSAVCFDLYNPSNNKSRVTVRIDDKKDYPDYMDRYNQPFDLKPGLNMIRIPLQSLKTSGTERLLDTGHIERMVVFMDHPCKKHLFYIDYLRLVRVKVGDKKG